MYAIRSYYGRMLGFCTVCNVGLHDALTIAKMTRNIEAYFILFRFLGSLSQFMIFHSKTEITLSCVPKYENLELITHHDISMIIEESVIIACEPT